MKHEKTIEDVKAFWNSNPLFVGETSFEPGTKEYFDYHKQVIVDDTFPGEIDPRIFPNASDHKAILDLGCGPGFWSVEFALRGFKDVTAADLTENALQHVKKRCEVYGVTVKRQQENAEKLTFASEAFTHVNCQGIVHHTPDTKAAVSEVARVLADNGTAVISVYYKNLFYRAWPVIKSVVNALSHFDSGLKGRGRENIFALQDRDEIVRYYDGSNNPIGKAYSREEFRKLLEPHFIIEDLYLHFFPARALPFRVPRFIHFIMDRYFGFMIYANVRKKRKNV